MKKLLPIILMLALLLTGCGLAEQAKTVREDYLDPAIESARAGESGGADGGEVSVVTDWSALTEYVPLTEVGTRLENDALTQFTPGNYGQLVPYIGAWVGDFPLYGLATAEGRVVLDSVLTSCDGAVWEQSGDMKHIPVYIVSGTVAADGGYARMYGLVAMDGSWATQLEYKSIVACSLGCMCIYDLENNLAVCYSQDGEKLFDTATFGALGEVADGYIETMAADSSNGYMPICYTSGRFGYMNTDGVILNRAEELASVFNAALPFTEGLAPAQINGKWGYLGTDGSWAIGLDYTDATQFLDGVAIATLDGALVAINTSGETLCTFPAGAEVTAVGNGYFCVNNGGDTLYCAADLESVTIDGIAASYGGDGVFWVAKDGGVKLKDGDQYVFASGASAYLGASGTGLYLVELADGSAAAVDSYGRVAALGSAFASDSCTGEVFILADDAVYSQSGALIADELIGDVGFAGCFLCADEVSSGFKSGGEWRLRLRLPAED